MIKEGSARLSHGPLHYLHSGRGPGAALLLHGLLATSFGWRACLRALAPTVECYALDFPGMAGSAPLPGYRAAIQPLAQCVAEFLAWRGWAGVTLIASSWGGAVALELAASQPERVARLVLAAPASPFFRPNGYQRLLMRRPLARCAAGLLRRVPRRWYQAGLRRMWAAPRPLDPAVVRGYLQPLRSPELSRVLPGFVAEWRRDWRALAGRLAGVRQPTLLIWGDRDRVVPLACAEPLRAALPHAHLHVLRGAGHLSFEEQPRRFNRAVLDFLARPFAPPAEGGSLETP